MSKRIEKRVCEVCKEVEARYIIEDTITEENEAYCVKCLPEKYKRQL